MFEVRRIAWVSLGVVLFGCAARQSSTPPPAASPPIADRPPAPVTPSEPPAEEPQSDELAAALQAARETCELGHGERCLGLGMALQEDGPTQDLPAAAAMLARACELDVAAGCFEHGQVLLAGRGVVADRAAALAKMMQACDMGLPVACMLAGMNSGDPELASGKRRLDAAEAGCKQGAADKCFAAGELYLNNELVGRDETKAFGYLERACKSKHVRACQGVASGYERGVGVAADPKRALKMWQAQCKAGDLDSCCHYGSLLMEGRIVAHAPAKALDVWDAACDKGSGSCCMQAGLLLTAGKDVPADPARALSYFQKSCDHGEGPGCGMLGDTYEYGSPASAIDLAKAEDAYLRACKLKSFKGCEFAHRLQQRRRPAQ